MPAWMIKFAKIIVISTIVGFLLHIYLFFSETAQFPNYISDISLGLLVFLFTNIIGTVLYFFNNAVNNIPFISEKANLRLISSISLNYVLLSSLLVLSFTVHINWFSNTSPVDFIATNTELLYKVFVLSFALVFLFVIIDFSVRSYQKFSQIKLNAVKSSREQSDLQLEAFKSQLSPHYLFNNLNTISLLVYKNPDLSEKYIRKLSQTYDYIIETNKKDLVKLHEEMEFIKAYKYLLDIRFQDNLQINLGSYNKDNKLLLPPLSVQILIENAVKHNSPTDENQLIVDIVISDKYLQVKNNILRAPSKTDSFKIGLNNIRKRYKFHTEKEIIIEKTNEFSIKIPLLHNKN
ncbi:MAG: hypothetical protein B6I20_12340 [Bacteroidetes bacterium 4572_117]|nr:MAG: hypothetical protein B6I20_12340 [Bacteroidetes bacterium 4572_117]